MEMAFRFDELDNTDNLEDGRLNNTLLTYHVTVSEEFMHLESVAPQYKRLKNMEFASQTLRIMDQKNNIMTDSLEVTALLHMR